MAAHQSSARDALRSDAAPRRRLGWGSLLLALLPCLLWARPLLLEYGYRDDYSIMREVVEEPGKIIAVCISEGRLFYGILLQTSFSLVNGVPALAVWRLFGAGLLGVVGVLLAWILIHRFRWHRAAAMAAGALFSLLPSAQLIAAWASCWPLALAGVLGLAAFALTDTGLASSGVMRRMSIFIGLTLLVMGMLTYQSNALLYVVPLAAGWITNRRPRWRWLLVHLVFVASALVLAFVATETSFRVLGFLPSRRFIVDVHLVSKVEWFLQHPFREALSLYVLHDVVARTEPWYSAMQAITGTLVLLAIVRRATPREAAARLGGFAVLLATAYAVSFVAVERWPTYRTLWPLTGVLLVAVVYEVSHWRAIVLARRPTLEYALAILLVAVVGRSTAWNVEWLLARPQAGEWARVRQSAIDFDPARREQVFLLLPYPADATAPIRHLDEFGSLSADGDWVAKEMFKQALHREHPDLPHTASRFTSQTGYALPRSLTARVFDFRDVPPTRRASYRRIAF